MEYKFYVFKMYNINNSAKTTHYEIHELEHPRATGDCGVYNDVRTIIYEPYDSYTEAFNSLPQSARKALAKRGFPTTTEEYEQFSEEFGPRPRIG